MKKTPMFFRIPKEWQILKHFIKHAKHLIYEEPGVSFKSFSDQSLQNFSQVGAFTLNSRYFSLDNKSSKTASIQRLFEVALVIKTKFDDVVVPDCVQPMTD